MTCMFLIRLHTEGAQNPSLGSFLPYSHSLDNIIQVPGSKPYLYTDDSQMSISSLESQAVKTEILGLLVVRG